MAGSKRERQLNRAKIARQQKAAAEAAERRKRIRVLAGVSAAILVVAVVGGIAAVNAGGDDDNATPQAATSASATPTATKSEKAADAKTSSVTCTEPNGKKPINKQYKKPDYKLMAGQYKETLTTNCGTIEFTMDQQKAPRTTGTIAFLSDRDGYFNNTMCHRVTTSGIYVLQCGDPKGDGTGGPGFEIGEENLPKAGADGTALYPRGTIAMANAGEGTTGSQFFIVYKDTKLPPNYTVLGEVTEGLDIVDYIAEQGVEGGGDDGTPVQPLQIQKMVSSLTYAVDEQ